MFYQCFIAFFGPHCPFTLAPFTFSMDSIAVSAACLFCQNPIWRSRRLEWWVARFSSSASFSRGCLCGPRWFLAWFRLQLRNVWLHYPSSSSTWSSPTPSSPWPSSNLRLSTRGSKYPRRIFLNAWREADIAETLSDPPFRLKYSGAATQWQFVTQVGF